jgi:hypothetical protein
MGKVLQTPSSAFEEADAAVGGGVRNGAGLTVVGMVEHRQPQSRCTRSWVSLAL